MSIEIHIPSWLARSENLATILEGEVLAESSKGILIEGTIKTLPSQSCLRCGRNITHPVSRVVGIGPECCEKLGIPRPDLSDATRLVEQLREAVHFKKWFPKSYIQIIGEYTLPESSGEREEQNPTLKVEGDMLSLYCSYSDNQMAKRIPGYKWSPQKNAWRYPLETSIIQQILKSFNGRVQLDESVQVLLQQEEKNTVQLSENSTYLRLYPFQKEGVEFLLKNKRALLADDMGLGKTVQAIAASTPLSQKTLVVCPNSLKRNWEREFHRWAPDRVVVVVEGEKPRREVQLQTSGDVYIVNWELLRLSEGGAFYHLETLKRMKFQVAILDEAHKVKNRKALVTKCTRELVKAIPYVYLLTGTPMMNRPDELWTLLNIISPKQFTSYWRFAERFCTLSYNGFGYDIGPLNPQREAELKGLLQSFVLRRTKGEVLKDMPLKTVQKILIPLEGEQKRIYQDMSRDMYTKLSQEEEVSASVVIAQITRLKQIAIDPYLMTGGGPTLSGAKIDALLDILEELGQKKVVIFSQFAEACKRLTKTLENAGYRGGYLIGEMSSQERDTIVQRFQSEEDFQFLVVSTLAGGVGLTLTAASTAVFLDKYWTPAINLQAQDRLHRIGQTEPVTIIELIAEGTVEEKIEELLELKYQQFKALFDIGDLGAGEIRLKRDEILNLLRGG